MYPASRSAIRRRARAPPGPTSSAQPAPRTPDRGRGRRGRRPSRTCAASSPPARPTWRWPRRRRCRPHAAWPRRRTTPGGRPSRPCRPSSSGWRTGARATTDAHRRLGSVDDPTERFAELVQGPKDVLDVNLDTAALLIAAHARPDLDLDVAAPTAPTARRPGSRVRRTGAGRGHATCCSASRASVATTTTTTTRGTRTSIRSSTGASASLSRSPSCSSRSPAASASTSTA